MVVDHEKTSIFDEIYFWVQKKFFLCCRHILKGYWRVRWVHLTQVSGSAYVQIIFYHEGLLMVQRGSHSDFPILRSQGGSYAPFPAIAVSEVALRRFKGLMFQNNLDRCTNMLRTCCQINHLLGMGLRALCSCIFTGFPKSPRVNITPPPPPDETSFTEKAPGVRFFR